MAGLPIPAECPSFNLGYISGDYRSSFIRVREWELCVFHQKIMPFRHASNRCMTIKLPEPERSRYLRQNYLRQKSPRRETSTLGTAVSGYRDPRLGRTRDRLSTATLRKTLLGNRTRIVGVSTPLMNGHHELYARGGCACMNTAGWLNSERVGEAKPRLGVWIVPVPWFRINGNPLGRSYWEWCWRSSRRG